MNTDWFHLTGAGAWSLRYGAAERFHVYHRTLTHFMPNTETTRIEDIEADIFFFSRDRILVAMGARPTLVLLQNPNPGALLN